MKRLVIYAGFHKTGTTAMQSALSACRDALLDAGVTYPKAKSGNAQHYLAKSPSSAARKKATDEIRHLLASSNHVLLASEFFSQFSEKSVQSLVQAFPNVDIQVVFSMRPLEQMVPSQYQQLVRIGLDKSYVDFVDSLLDLSSNDQHALLFWNRHDQARLISRWVKYLGPQKVHVVQVDPGDPKFLFTWFEKYLKLNPGTLVERNQEDLNRSLDAEELELIRTLRKLLGEDRVATEWIRLFRDRFIKELVSKASSNPHQIRLQMTQRQRATFERLSAEAEKQVAQQQVQIYKSESYSIGKVHNQKVGSSAPLNDEHEISKIHIESVARAIVAIRPKDSIKVVSTSQLVKELLKRLGVLSFTRNQMKKLNWLRNSR